MPRQLLVSLAIAMFLIYTGIAMAQSDSDILIRARQESKHSVFFPISLLIPTGILSGYDLRDYIASEAFAEFDSTHSADETFDEIYSTAVEYNHGDVENSLLSAAYGSFEHESIPFRFFGGTLNIPLTSETKARFLLRRSHLPKHLYRIPEGDQDKPQHFFASAWLKATLKMDWLVNLFGNLVEEGESAFLVGGSRDPRDIHANQDGLRFALEAESHFWARPSRALTPNP